MHTTNGWYYGQAYQLYSSTRLSSSATGNAVTGNCAINAPRARIQITRKRDGKRDIIGELERAQRGRRWRWRRDEGNESRQPIEIKYCGGAMEGINSNSRAISVDQVFGLRRESIDRVPLYRDSITFASGFRFVFFLAYLSRMRVLPTKSRQVHVTIAETRFFRDNIS